MAVIRSLGGDYARVDRHGKYRLRVTTPGRYYLLIVSQHAKRESGQQPQASDLAQIGRYFVPATSLLESQQYTWKEMRIRDNTGLDWTVLSGDSRPWTSRADRRLVPCRPLARCRDSTGRRSVDHTYRRARITACIWCCVVSILSQGSCPRRGSRRCRKRGSPAGGAGTPWRARLPTCHVVSLASPVSMTRRNCAWEAASPRRLGQDSRPR